MHRARRWLPPLLLVAVFIGLRLVLIEADPPLYYPTGDHAWELFVEGPAKAHEARRYGLFGTFATNAADEYHIWSVQSPVYVVPLSRFFRVFGTGYTQLRIFCAFAAGLGLLALYGLARQHSNGLVAPIACLLSAVSFFDIQLTRSALLEPYLNALLCVTFLTGVLSTRKLPWLLLCELGLFLALLVKQTALFAFPALFFLGGYAQLAAWRRKAPRWQHAVTIAFGCALATVLVLYVRTPEYWRTVEWNFGHMIVGVEQHEALSMGSVPSEAFLGRVIDWERWRDGFVYIVPLGVLALLQVGRTLLELVRRRPAALLDVVASAWLLSALLILLLTERVLPRYSIIVLPPASLLTASFCGFVVTRARGSRFRHVPLLAVAAMVLVTDLRWQAKWWSSPRYDMRSAAAILRRHVDARSVVIGAWASPLAFDTAAEVFYIRSPGRFNDSRKTMAALGITHLLAKERRDILGHVRKHFPGAFAAKQQLARVRVGDDDYTLYRFARPLASTLGK